MRRDFPGMQWFGDGKQLTIVLRGKRFTFNLEAFVDGATAATVGAIVSATEDARAVVDAFDDGLRTVEGQVPMAVTVDNRPSTSSPTPREPQIQYERVPCKSCWRQRDP